MQTEVIEPYRSYLTNSLEGVADDLESYAKLIVKWQAVQNLVSRETLPDIWKRHFADSLQILRYVNGSDVKFLDFGSGGGFPALPMAIGRKGSGQHFTLIEPTTRKVSFLRTVIRELNLNASVIGRRSDAIDSRETGRADVITSRALASLTQLLDWINPFFALETRAILHKGREHVEEITQARAHWDFDVLTYPSDTDPSGVILVVRNLRRKSVR